MFVFRSNTDSRTEEGATHCLMTTEVEEALWAALKDSTVNYKHIILLSDSFWCMNMFSWWESDDVTAVYVIIDQNVWVQCKVTKAVVK